MPTSGVIYHVMANTCCDQCMYHIQSFHLYHSEDINRFQKFQKGLVTQVTPI